MSNKKLHIVSFDVPYPPNYGGVIDVFFKVKTLYKFGVEIYLHAFEYGRGQPKELEQFCKKIYYYERNAIIKSVLSTIPFIVKSRSSEELVFNLKKIEAPILFEGLHTTFPLINENFKSRKVLVRTHNIEHFYYQGLSKSEKRIDKKVFFKAESKKLEPYENILKKTDSILTISPSEQVYFKNKFNEKAVYIPVFHQNTKVAQLSTKGDYALYHGDLRVSDNIKSALFLIEVFENIDYPLLIASSFENELVLKVVEKHKHISFIEIRNEKHVQQLLNKAHINVLPTFQKTGIKLKLINTLFNSRFCVVTNEMVEDTGLENLCSIGTTTEEFKIKTLELINKAFTMKEANKRMKALISFDVKKSGKKIVDLLY